MTRGGGVEVAELTLINEGTRLRSGGEFSVTTSVHVAAPPAEVFNYFTDPARYVRWMGAEAKLNPVAGGEYRIRMGDGFEAAGEFTELDPPRRLVFTWGFADTRPLRRPRILRRARRPLAASCRPAAPASPSRSSPKARAPA
jgi:Activator of Hsp90 ATPase homolog 1-like protein